MTAQFTHGEFQRLEVLLAALFGEIGAEVEWSCAFSAFRGLTRRGTAARRREGHG